jgi:hypothetical protein
VFRVPNPGSPGGNTRRTERARSRAGIGEQFAEGLPLNTALLGPALAKALSTTTGMGLAGLSDDALAGYLGACQKVAAWAAALLLDGIAEYADRRPDDATPRRAAWHAAAASRAQMVAAVTGPLSPAQAAEVEALILGLAGQQTYAALGRSLGKAVLRVDPAGAVRRRERAEKRTRVERFREYDGTGALAGRNLPPGDTLAADQALTALALDLRAAGLDGPLDYLRATALIDQITGRDSRPAPFGPANSGTRSTPGHRPAPTGDGMPAPRPAVRRRPHHRLGPRRPHVRVQSLAL